VFEGVTAEGEGLVGAAEVRAATWMSIDEGEPDSALLSVLDRGEAAAIPLAERLGATLLADDAAAREIARTRGLHVVGTLGVLLAAKRKDLIAEVAPVIALMESLGMFVSERLRAEVRRLAGE
jgi:predicted nucleic acid-binding protein